MTFKEVRLSRGQSCLVSESDFQAVNSRRWFASFRADGGNFYACRMASRSEGKRRMIYMHREIISAPPGALVDHINHDTLDNRRENLRLATPSQNVMNRSVQRNSTTGVLGVSRGRREGKWRAQIAVGGKKVHIGEYFSVAEASAAYQSERKRLFGAFA